MQGACQIGEIPNQEKHETITSFVLRYMVYLSEHQYQRSADMAQWLERSDRGQSSQLSDNMDNNGCKER